MILDIYEKCNAEEGCRERWKRWEAHREKINAALAAQPFSEGKLEDGVILGAGRCEDIDLKFLLKNIGSLVLVDYDYGSMELALEKQQLSLEERKRVSLVGNVEFTGFYTEGFINQITDWIEKKEEPDKVVQLAMDHLESARGCLAECLGGRQFSLVMTGAVHSQLIVPYTQLAALDMDYWDSLMYSAVVIADKLCEGCNQGLLSLVKEGGWLFAYYDIMELSERNGTAQFEGLINQSIAVGNQGQIDALIFQYGGVAGARHGYGHLEETAKPYKPCGQSWIWNFRDNKKYYVRSLCFRKA